MKKNSAKPGLRCDTSTNHGAAMSRKINPPETGRMRRHNPKSRRHAPASSNTQPGITMPTSPLLSTAPPMAAQAIQTQRRRTDGSSSAHSANNAAHSVSVRNSVKPASSVRKWLLQTIQVVEAVIAKACTPASLPHKRAAVSPTVSRVKKPARPGHKRAENSETPNHRKLSAPIQYWSAGFSK